MGPDERSAVGWFNTFIDINCSRLQRYSDFLIPTIANLCHIVYHYRGIRYLFAFLLYIKVTLRALGVHALAQFLSSREVPRNAEKFSNGQVSGNIFYQKQGSRMLAN